jgi:predicted nuclease with RNAse H fold
MTEKQISFSIAATKFRRIAKRAVKSFRRLRNAVGVGEICHPAKQKRIGQGDFIPS